MNPSSILCKVVVTEVSEDTPFLSSEKVSESVTMEPVSATSPENETFSAATPVGKIQLVITNKAAWGFFVKGNEHKVQFDPAQHT